MTSSVPLAPEPQQAPRRALALVAAGRIVAASPALADLTGYTRNELTSPEFELGHIFAGETPPCPAPAAMHELAADEALIVPLRGAPTPCRRTVVRLGGADASILALVLSTGQDAGPADALEARTHAMREVVRAYSSQLAGAIVQLRKIQLRIESIEHAHAEVLAHDLRRAGPIIDAIQKLEDDVDALGRAAGSGR